MVTAVEKKDDATNKQIEAAPEENPFTTLLTKLAIHKDLTIQLCPIKEEAMKALGTRKPAVLPKEDDRALVRKDEFQGEVKDVNIIARACAAGYKSVYRSA